MHNDRTGLVWWNDLGMGVLEVPEFPSPYNKAYFERYAKMSDTDIGRALNGFRVGLVHEVAAGVDMVDVGCGAGTFIEARNTYYGKRVTFGYDVNPWSAHWLCERDLCIDPLEDRIEAVSFWDSLEHIRHPEVFLKGKRAAFVSMPVFHDLNDVLTSKHFRPLEHRLYFTESGLKRWFWDRGFECALTSWGETRLGRESIISCAFLAKG